MQKKNGEPGVVIELEQPDDTYNLCFPEGQHIGLLRLAWLSFQLKKVIVPCRVVPFCMEPLQHGGGETQNTKMVDSVNLNTETTSSTNPEKGYLS